MTPPGALLLERDHRLHLWKVILDSVVAEVHAWPHSFGQLPHGVTISASQNGGQGADVKADIMISVSNSTAPGTYQIVISVLEGSGRQDTTYFLDVKPVTSSVVVLTVPSTGGTVSP